jgi:uncharacterized cupin superfamily protein
MMTDGGIGSTDLQRTNRRSAMKLNIQDVPAEKVTGREIRNMINSQVQGSQDMTLQIVDVLPGAISKPGHSHTNCEEIIYVAAGEGDILIQDRVWHLVPGDVVLLPRGVKHLTRNPCREKMRLICVFSSAHIREGMVFDESLDYPEASVSSSPGVVRNGAIDR